MCVTVYAYNICIHSYTVYYVVCGQFHDNVNYCDTLTNLRELMVMHSPCRTIMFSVHAETISIGKYEISTLYFICNFQTFKMTNYLESNQTLLQHLEMYTFLSLYIS